ncbi:MAG: phage baseplate protein [Treponema sp.]
MPQGWKENQNAAEVEAQKQEANRTLNELINGIKPLYNAVRNKRGSITLPEPQDDSDAATKNFTTKLIQEKIAALINSAPAELDTLKELADALIKNKDGITAINKALANRYTKEEADDNIKNQIAALVNNAPAELDTLKELADAVIKNKNDIENFTVPEYVKYAERAGVAESVQDFNSNNKIKIGYNGALTADRCVYLAGYNVSGDIKIEGISKTEIQKWLAICSIDDTLANYIPNAMKDYGDPSGNRKIQVGYAGPPLQAGELLHLAGYTQAGSKLKDVTEDAVRQLLGLTQKHIVDMIYPIGSVYLTMDGKDPKELFSGTKWKKISEGKYLTGVGVGRDVNKTLQGIGVVEGAGEYFHKLTINEMLSHRHNVEVCNDGNPDGKRDRSSGADCQYWNTQDNRTRVQYNVTPHTDYKDGHAPHNNMPPYFGVFVWQRTA